MNPWELAARLMLAVALTLIATRGMARTVGYIRQPPVVGEIIAGLLLGPTLLGALPGNPSKVIFPSQVTGVLTSVAQIGIVLYLFLVGLDLDVEEGDAPGRSLVAISLSSLVLPFALGALLTIQLYGSHHVVAGKVVNPLAFTLFIGTALAMTALPVLARILTDTGLQRGRLGRLAIGCAAILDALGWILLALALAVASSTGVGALGRTLGEAAVLVAVLVLVVRPLLARQLARQAPSQRASVGYLLLVVAITFVSAEITKAIGLDLLLGAVLFGAVYPGRGNPASTRAIKATLTPVTVSALLPLYFLLPGLHVNLRHLGGTGGLLELALILLCACGGKFIGAAGATRACGYSWRDAAVMGTLMNTRGLIELVILNVGLAAHVLDSRLYGLMVVMALTTTMMTGPLLQLIHRPRLGRARLLYARPPRA